MAAGIGGWLGLTAASFTTALMFGIQPCSTRQATAGPYTRPTPCP